MSGYIAATFVNGPWNGSIRQIEASRLEFDVMGSPTEKWGTYRKVAPSLDPYVSFSWEVAEVRT